MESRYLVDAALGRNEEDPEIRELLKSSVGVNLALDYLPGSATFDPAARDAVDARLASSVVWFDAFVTNVDRTPRNPNLLWWHKTLYMIDHGAALYFHHNWGNVEEMAKSRFPNVREHVLLPWASELESADAQLRPLLGESTFAGIVRQIPDDWISPDSSVSPAERRAGYVTYLTRRLESSSIFLEEAVRARAQLL